jgi:hypothetical protein
MLAHRRTSLNVILVLLTIFLGIVVQAAEHLAVVILDGADTPEAT